MFYPNAKTQRCNDVHAISISLSLFRGVMLACTRISRHGAMWSLVEALRACPSFRPGIAYVLGEALYLAPSTRSAAGRTMRSCRGGRFASARFPGASQPDAHAAPLPVSTSSTETATAAATGFVPLPAGASEPTGKELADLVNEFIAAAAAAATTDGAAATTDAAAGTGAGTSPSLLHGVPVVFQGNGDSLSAVDTVLSTVDLVASSRSQRGLASVPFRLNTLGLCDASTTERLLASSAFHVGHGIAQTSVFLPSANPTKYAEMLQPHGDFGCDDVCRFISAVAAAGHEVEVTAVDRPDVDIDELELLAHELGASSFRTRSWVG